MGVLELSKGDHPMRALGRFMVSKHFLASCVGHAVGLIVMCIYQVPIKVMPCNAVVGKRHLVPAGLPPWLHA